MYNVLFIISPTEHINSLVLQEELLMISQGEWQLVLLLDTFVAKEF